jgi:hypothetical protein
MGRKQGDDGVALLSCNQTFSSLLPSFLRFMREGVVPILLNSQPERYLLG